jgi:hypothetical protein
MDPITWMMLCSTIEAGASLLMGISLFALAYMEWRNRLDKFRVDGANSAGER